MLVHGTIHKEPSIACCGLNLVPTRACENVHLALRESFEQGKLSGPLCRPQAVPRSVGFLGKTVRMAGWAVAMPRSLKD